jgi:cellulose biosynthesis protein BcsQ
MARKIAVRIKKGGGNKSTAAINLATSLYKKGKDKNLRVLLVDLDPQANATLAVGIDPKTLKKNINHLFTDISVHPKDVIVKTSFGLDIPPSHPDLSNTESGMQATQLGVIRSLLAPLEKLYDFIILDTPPAKSYFPRSRSQVEPYDFCVRRGNFSRWRVKDGQKCPCKDSNVAASMLTTLCSVAGDHPWLTL